MIFSMVQRQDTLKVSFILSHCLVSSESFSEFLSPSEKDYSTKIYETIGTWVSCVAQ